MIHIIFALTAKRRKIAASLWDKVKDKNFFSIFFLSSSDKCCPNLYFIPPTQKHKHKFKLSSSFSSSFPSSISSISSIS